MRDRLSEHREVLRHRRFHELVTGLGEVADAEKPRLLRM